jgi:alginate O-acetyltransferase complex protein AlgI
MEFNSLIFPIFFIIVATVYYNLERKNQNRWLLICSYFFYGWWDWRFCSLLLFSTLLDWNISKKIYSTDSINSKKILLSISLLGNLGVLSIFKYYDFFTTSFHFIFSQLGFKLDYVSLNFILPMGISFYTFQTMAYSIDVFRGKQKPPEDISTFALYVSFFPQLVAGPIERANRLLPQFSKVRKFSFQNINNALPLILFGFFKKVVIADSVSLLVDNTFSNPNNFSNVDLILCSYIFSFQIYCDFSGYSDIAKGVARMLGIKISSNFSSPYSSSSITEFWRRWHMSLSSWLKDYLYISLGGNRKGTLRTYLNLIITMLLGGLWHGPSWNFIVWGGLHGIWLSIHKISISLKLFEKFDYIRYSFLKLLIKKVFIFNLVSFIWIFFRSSNFNLSIEYIKGIFFNEGDVSLFIPFILAGAGVFFIDIGQIINKDYLWLNKLPSIIKMTLIFVLLISIVLVFGVHYDNPSPFIYFQF